jgi:hypothetical protein
MDKGTFGSCDQYRMLEFLTEKISLMEVKSKNYLSSVIQDINNIVKKTNTIEDGEFKNYVLELIDIDLSNRINNHVKNKYEEKIFSYLMNYLNAKIKNAKQK